MLIRAHRRRGLGDDSDPAVSIWGDLPFSDPGVSLQPVGVSLPDVSNIPGLNPPVAGVTSDAGMSVVTVTATPAAGIPGWVWVALVAGGLYLWGRS